MVLALIPAAITTTFGLIVDFTNNGIGAGSIAAFCHSIIGNVVGGSFFATLQSAGATGLTSIVSGVCGAIYSIFK